MTHTMLVYFFWACVAFVFYAYVGYPLMLALLGRWRGRDVDRSDISPDVSLIITARNEEQRIGAKIENTLALDYPGVLEIIIASDCSTDGTHSIVADYATSGVRLVVAPERRGKEFAQQSAIAAASNDILVFSDVATHLAPHGLRRIVANFADPTVGCVTSVDRLVGPDGRVSGEGAYVKYETLLRVLETRLGSVIGLSGSFFAARRDVCQSWPVDLPSDFTTVLNTLRCGMRGVTDPESIGYYRDLADSRREYARKVRTIVRGMSALFQHLELLNPFRYGLFAWQLCSHKLCRWIVPFALFGALGASIALSTGSPLYASMTIAQLVGYVVAAATLVGTRQPAGIRKILAFFVMANVSILNAWFNLVRGRRVVAWEPSRRNDLARP